MYYVPENVFFVSFSVKMHSYILVPIDKTTPVMRQTSNFEHYNFPPPFPPFCQQEPEMKIREKQHGATRSEPLQRGFSLLFIGVACQGGLYF